MTADKHNHLLLQFLSGKELNYTWDILKSSFTQQVRTINDYEGDPRSITDVHSVYLYISPQAVSAYECVRNASTSCCEIYISLRRQEGGASLWCGTAMGTHLAPSYANTLYISKHGNTTLFCLQNILFAVTSSFTSITLKISFSFGKVTPRIFLPQYLNNSSCGLMFTTHDY